jgi:hypothetical protein
MHGAVGGSGGARIAIQRRQLSRKLEFSSPCAALIQRPHLNLVELQHQVLDLRLGHGVALRSEGGDTGRSRMATFAPCRHAKAQAPYPPARWFMASDPGCAMNGTIAVRTELAARVRVEAPRPRPNAELKRPPMPWKGPILLERDERRSCWSAGAAVDSAEGGDTEASLGNGVVAADVAGGVRDTRRMRPGYIARFSFFFLFHRPHFLNTPPALVVQSCSSSSSLLTS